MIVTQKIPNTTAVPKSIYGFETINVLNWTRTPWTDLSPYKLKTDGQEENVNPGGVIFENFWQGSKVYDVVYDNKVYSSKFQYGNPAYLWWIYEPVDPQGDRLVDSHGNIDYNLYNRWKNELWACSHPIRYPNKIHRRKNVQFGLIVDKNGNEERLDYIEFRKRVYFQEYTRLIRQLNIYQHLLDKLKNGTNLLICEVDVPAKGKKGEYGKNVENGNCTMTLERINLLLNDPSEPFGHGLALSHALLSDL